MRYEVRAKSGVAEAVIEAMVKLITLEHAADESGIVYCFSQRETELVASGLCAGGVSCAAYHAGMADDARAAVHADWSANRMRVIAATVAFGMGINKADVR